MLVTELGVDGQGIHARDICMVQPSLKDWVYTSYTCFLTEIRVQQKVGPAIPAVLSCAGHQDRMQTNWEWCVVPSCKGWY